jgi:hypothetical protein
MILLTFGTRLEWIRANSFRDGNSSNKIYEILNKGIPQNEI